MTIELIRWDEAAHPRIPHGKGGGRFASKPGGGRGRKEGGPWSRSGDTVTYHGNLGINRGDMPQLSGLDADGVYHPSAEMVPKFITRLRAQGISVRQTRIRAAALRPTQTTGDMPAIRRIADSVKSGEMEDVKRITVSMDHHVLDGHHNWAGRLLADAEGGRPGLAHGMPVVQVGLPMPELIAQAEAFAAEHGIGKRKAGQFANPVHASRWAIWRPGQHPRVAHGEHGGEFTAGGDLPTSPASAALKSGTLTREHVQAVDRIAGGRNKPLVSTVDGDRIGWLENNDGKWDAFHQPDVRVAARDAALGNPTREAAVQALIGFHNAQVAPAAPGGPGTGIHMAENRQRADQLRELRYDLAAAQQQSGAWSVSPPGDAAERVRAAADALERGSYAEALGHLRNLRGKVAGGRHGRKTTELLAKLDEQIAHLEQVAARRPDYAKIGQLEAAAGIGRASAAGHHVPGTPYEWRHDWQPLSFGAAQAKFHHRVPSGWQPGDVRKRRGPGPGAGVAAGSHVPRRIAPRKGVSTPQEFHAKYLPRDRERLDRLKAEADRLAVAAAKQPNMGTSAERLKAYKAMGKYQAAVKAAVAKTAGGKGLSPGGGTVRPVKTSDTNQAVLGAAEGVRDALKAATSEPGGPRRYGAQKPRLDVALGRLTVEAGKPEPNAQAMNEAMQAVRDAAAGSNLQVDRGFQDALGKLTQAVTAHQNLAAVKPDRLSGEMRHGDWQAGYQAVGPAPVHVLAGGRQRAVTIEGRKDRHTVTGSWSDPWWMTNGRGGWAVSRRWRNKSQTGYDWSGSAAHGRAETFPIPAADERVLTPVDATGNPLSGEAVGGGASREFPALHYATAHAAARANATGEPHYITPSGNHWVVGGERPPWGNHYTVDAQGNWKRQAGPGARSYGGYQPNVVKMDGPPAEGQGNLLSDEHPANQQNGPLQKLEARVAGAEAEEKSAHSVYAMALSDSYGPGGGFDPKSPKAQVAEKLRREWQAAKQAASAARMEYQAARAKISQPASPAPGRASVAKTLGIDVPRLVNAKSLQGVAPADQQKIEHALLSGDYDAVDSLLKAEEDRLNASTIRGVRKDGAWVAKVRAEIAGKVAKAQRQAARAS